MDYKNTLNMPQTDFDMRANLTQKEENFRLKWEEEKLYEKIMKKNKGNTPFILHDGPPYANGDLHIGHALNKILKDVIIRYKSMSGFYTPYIVGWDTHGLPIENKMLDVLKMDKNDLNKLELRKKAEEYALSQVANQKSQFKTMQLLSDLKEDYVTLRPNYEAGQLKLFKEMILKGLIYKGLKPVYWSPTSQSALAEAEVEYQDHTSPSIIVTLDIVGSENKLAIYTTTPWTLIANSGVAVGKDFDYSLLDTSRGKIWIATDLIENFKNLASKKVLDINEAKIIKTVKGEELVGLKYFHPINAEEQSPVIEGHHVTTSDGTGLVHIAPLFGEDDFIIGKEVGLKMIMHMEDDGTLNEQAGKWAGTFYADSNKDIGMFLEEKGSLISLKFIKHSYPHDWRTHKPIVYRGTPQWFVSIKKIKPQILKALEGVNSYPSWGVNRMSKMIDNRDDWTISRQRTWGVPIIVFYDENENPVVEEEIFDYVIKLVEEHGTNIWVEKSVDELLPKKYRGRNWTKEEDIMDVWFDSGSSFISVKPGGENAPFDLYLEGSDQYRGWFNSSLINGVAYMGKSPYKNLVSHGFVLDGKGNKMSKSKGNVVSPHKIISKQGADILRLWVSNSEYTSDITISDDIIKQTSEIYRNIRTKVRFMLGNLFDFKETVELDGVHALQQELLETLIFNIKTYYDKYEFSKVVKEVNKFLSDMSSFYLNFSKDILYIEKHDSPERLKTQTVIYNTVDMLTRALAPIIPTTAEEIWSKFNKTTSVHLEEFPIVDVKTTHINQWKEFFELKDKVYKIVENAIKEQKINRINEAVVHIEYTPSSFIKTLNLKQLLMVAEITFSDKDLVEKFEGSSKCQRCWNHYKEADMNEDICNRCDEVIKK